MRLHVLKMNSASDPAESRLIESDFRGFCRGGLAGWWLGWEFLSGPNARETARIQASPEAIDAKSKKMNVRSSKTDAAGLSNGEDWNSARHNFDHLTQRF